MLPARRILSADNIEEMAAAFRQRYAPGVTGALDIEVILEHDLGITFVPRPSLAFRTRRKAWLSCTGSRIVVDEGLMMGSLGEYRFLVAEEGGHAVLHHYLLPAEPFAGETEFRRWHSAITKEMERWLEWQARTWAGRVLVPRAELAQIFDRSVAGARRIFRTFALNEAAKLYIEEEVAAHFGVSPYCAHVRIDQDGLWADASAGIASAGLRLMG